MATTKEMLDLIAGALALAEKSAGPATRDHIHRAYQSVCDALEAADKEAA